MPEFDNLKDKKNFNDLILKYQPRLYKLIQRYIDNPAEAADVMQESFLKAYQGLSSFKGQSHFYTWLYRIAVNTAKNHLLLNQHSKMHVKLDDLCFQKNLQPAYRDISTPENLLLKQELEQALYKALKELPQDLTAAFMLRTLAGRSYQEIATIMHCPVGTIRSRISRARTTLAAAYH